MKKKKNPLNLIIFSIPIFIIVVTFLLKCGGIDIVNILSSRNKYKSESYIVNTEIIDTVYPTDDTVIANYTIKPEYGDGVTDATAAIQGALNACSNNHGGTVWLPAGKYLVTDTIHVPTLCTLRGDWQDPDTASGINLQYGTIIIADAASLKGKSALFYLNNSSGVVGLTIYYKGQTLNNILDNHLEWTFLYHLGKLFTIKNCTVINGYYGIGKPDESPASAVTDFPNNLTTERLNKIEEFYSQTVHESLMIENVKGSFVKGGVYINNSSDVGTISGLNILPKYWGEANMSALEPGVTSPSSSEVASLSLANNSFGIMMNAVEQQQMADIQIAGMNYGVYIPSIDHIYTRNAMTSGLFYNLNIHDVNHGIYIQEHGNNDQVNLDWRFGMLISDSTISGSQSSITNHSVHLSIEMNPSIDSNIPYKDDITNNALEKTDENKYLQGTIKLNNVTLNGKTFGPVLYNNDGIGSAAYAKKADDATTLTKSIMYNGVNKDVTHNNQKTMGNNLEVVRAGATASQINAAILRVYQSGGGVVYLEPGEYFITETIHVKGNVELRGASNVGVRNSGIYYADNNKVPYGTILNVSGSGDYQVIGISGSYAGVSGLYIAYSPNISLMNNSLDRSCNSSGTCSNGSISNTSYAIIANGAVNEGTDHIFINNVTINGAVNGINLANVHHFTIKNIVSAVFNNNISLNSCDNGTITNCLQNPVVMFAQYNNKYLYNGNYIDGHPGIYQMINIANPLFITKDQFIDIKLKNSNNIEMKNVFTYGAKNVVSADNSRFVAINTGADTFFEAGYVSKNTYPMFNISGSDSWATIINSARFNGGFLNATGGPRVNMVNNAFISEVFKDTDNTLFFVPNGIKANDYVLSSTFYKTSLKDIKDATISLPAKIYYSGSSVTPTPTVKYGTNLVENTDYEVFYKNNENVGTGTMIVTGTGDYYGTKEIDFEILDSSSLPKYNTQISITNEDSIIANNGSLDLITEENTILKLHANNTKGTVNVTIENPLVASVNKSSCTYDINQLTSLTLTGLKTGSTKLIIEASDVVDATTNLPIIGTYIINLNIKSNNANLAELKYNNKVVPDFNKNTLVYTLPDTYDTSINISAVPEDTSSTITGIGTFNLTLESNNVFTIKVTSSNNVTKSYNIKVYRRDPRSANNDLSTIGVNDNSKVVQTDLTTYSFDVGYNIDEVNISATLKDNKASFVTNYGPRTETLNMGINNFLLQVTAENGSIKDYHVLVNKHDDRSTDNKLKSISINGTKYTDLSSDTIDIIVGYNVTKAVISAELNDSKASFITDYGLRTVNLTMGENNIPLKVKAENGNIKEYIINITKIDDRDSNNDLNDLEVKNYLMTFEAATTEYNLNVNDYPSSVLINATLASTKAKFKDGYGPRTINLVDGTNKLSIIVVAENGNEKEYIININRTIVGNSDNTLKALSVGSYDLSPQFDAETLKFNVSVTGATSSVDINAELNNSNASFVSGYGNRTVNLEYGSNLVYVRVKAGNLSVRVYEIKINRPDPRSTDNSLKTLSVTGSNIGFDKDINIYNVNVGYNTSSTKITASLSNVKATFVSGYGPRTVNIAMGNSSALLKVKAENGSVKTYTINFTRSDDRSSDNSLKSFKINNESIKLNNSINEYSVNVDKTITKVTLSGELNDSKASFVENYGLRDINMNKSLVSVSIKIKAENGDIRTIILNISLKDTKSNDNTLSKLIIDDEELPLLKDNTVYNLEVPYEKETLTIITALNSSSASFEDFISPFKMSLNVGLNNKVIKVKAENGDSVEYVLNITRNANPAIIEEPKKDENPNTGGFLNYVVILLIPITIVSLIIVNKKRRLFKL